MAARSDASTLIEREAKDTLYVFDRRIGRSDFEILISFKDVKKFDVFCQKIKEELDLKSFDDYVITTTNRELIRNQADWGNIEAGDTVYILNSAEQQLDSQTHERVSYLPHYDTIIKGGMYEYYASEGQNPLPYAFAELIDNALAATANNVGPRNIEIRLYLDEVTPSRTSIYVLDNGQGMTSRQLNNWAVYRLSKFIRNNKPGKLSDSIGDVKDNTLDEAPRSLNSDISYFGVGGKQAIFYLGAACRMITRPEGSLDIHELTISRDDFEEKERNKEAIYTGFIRNRKIGDTSHLGSEEETLKNMIESEEAGLGHFTMVCVNNISPCHVPYLKTHLSQWTRQLAHIYHYYLHGPNGNINVDSALFNKRIPDEKFSKISIQVKLYQGNKVTKMIDLRSISDDMQSLFIDSACSSFEFKATVEGTGIVEGVLRYHPFLYDHETYPTDELDPRTEADPELDHDYSMPIENKARGRRPIFECYWNGRLIPYTFVDSLDWCETPKKSRVIPMDCYSRISGVLWANDKFQVSTNKLTFLDLELKLKDKLTAYSRVIGKTEKRTDIAKEFQSWLKECHEQCDKQIKFCQFVETISRQDLPRSRQYPWAVYKEILWDNKTFQEGQLVHIFKTSPAIYGKIKRFLLYGDYEGDIYATGGELELVQLSGTSFVEPVNLHGEVRIVALSKLDRTMSQSAVKQYLDDEDSKLPNSLEVTFPEGSGVVEGEKRPAGQVIGDVHVRVKNRKGDYMSKLPGSSQRKLFVELKLIWHSPNGDETIIQHVSQHGKNWGYWFRKMTGVTKKLGQYTLQLSCIANEQGTLPGINLPSKSIPFSIVEGAPKTFAIGLLDGPFRIGVEFCIPVNFQDEFGNLTAPPVNSKPVFEASGLDLSYEELKMNNTTLMISGVTAIGIVPTAQGKNFTLTLSFPELEKSKETMKIRLYPGPPATLLVKPDLETVTLENGHKMEFTVSVTDVAGNLAPQPQLVVSCQVQGLLGLPVYHENLTSSGAGTLVIGPLKAKELPMDGLKLSAKFTVQNANLVTSVAKTIQLVASKDPSGIRLYKMQGDSRLLVPPSAEIRTVAGDFVQHLTFDILDESGSVKDIDDKVAQKIKANWTPKLPLDMLRQGRLPDIKAPTNVSDVKYCVLSFSDTAQVEFNIVPVAGEVTQLKCLADATLRVRLKEELNSAISVQLVDTYGNLADRLTDEMLADLTVTGEGVMESVIKKFAPPTSNATFIITNVKFHPCPPGRKEIVVLWRKFKDVISIELLAGPPEKLTFPSYDQSHVYTVVNGTTLSQGLVAQLCDAFNNPTTPINADKLRVFLLKDSGLKVQPTLESVRVNEAGQADFGVLTISAKPGKYTLQAKMSVGRSHVLGPKLQLEVVPDKTKVMEIRTELAGDCSEYVVGECMPEITISVMAEDGVLISGHKNVTVIMGLVVAGSDKRNVKEFQPDMKRKNDKEGVYVFSKKKFPEVCGKVTVEFTYTGNGITTVSNALEFDVKPTSPCNLVPLVSPGTPTVSNAKSAACRVLIRSLQLQLKDRFDNDITDHVPMNVKVEVMCNNRDVTELPLLVGNCTSITLPVNKGRVHLHNVNLQDNCPGKDGQEYALRLTVQDLPKNQQVPPYDIPFLFYNDVNKQQQMAALSVERDNLKAIVNNFQQIFETSKLLVMELQNTVTELKAAESKMKSELRSSGLTAAQLATSSTVSAALNQLTAERDGLVRKQRRVCTLPRAPEHTEILGKIAHLAEIENEDIARVLSWHMSADMDCIVSLTTRKAKELFKDTGGKQQVLPLDSIYRKTLPDWTKPLPHERYRHSWRPAGNPMFARNCLVFPKDPENCKIVFGMLLGDTIIMDSLDDANDYRQELVKYTHCPTILTRDGDRIRSNGKFGGLMNKALPLEKLHGVVFAEPLSPRYHILASQIEQCKNLQHMQEQRQQREEELIAQKASMETPGLKKQKEECQEAEEHLKVIEERLGLQNRSIQNVATDEQTQSPKMASPASASSLRSSVRRAALAQRASKRPMEDDFVSFEKKRSRRN